MPANIIRQLNMIPHPEGGSFVESYRANGLIPARALPDGFSGDRSYSTAIYFLLEGGQKSHLHRIRQDETWHFYLGDPLRLVMIGPSGDPSEIILGQDILAGQHLQYTVPAGVWFGATPAPGAIYSLVGCTVAPGFDFADFELASGTELKKAWPSISGLISEFVLPGK
ncbi:cupin [Deltaproteobacteria bacterium Smac51]|nr:cupin [Deltaproteobacteria bacterium Smac51]